MIETLRKDSLLKKLRKLFRDYTYTDEWMYNGLKDRKDIDKERDEYVSSVRISDDEMADIMIDLPRDILPSSIRDTMSPAISNIDIEKFEKEVLEGTG